MPVYKKCNLKAFTVIIFLSYSFCQGQKQIDTLLHKSYKELSQLFQKETDFDKKVHLVNVYIKKGKKDNDIEKIMAGYTDFAILFKDEKVLLYSDSILRLSKPINANVYSSAAYQKKGEYYTAKRNFTKALDNFILAKDYGIKANHNSLIFYSNYGIGYLKNLLGEYSEVHKINQQNYRLAKTFKGKDNQTYLRSISKVASSFNDLKQLDSAFYYNYLGYQESILLDNKAYPFFFTVNQGVTHYFNNEYQLAIDSIQKSITYLEQKKSKSFLSLGYYYLGQSYLKKNEEDIALAYFKKVDTIFQNTGYLIPDFKKTYEYLINYSERINDLKSQLYYTNQLKKMDSISRTIYTGLNKKMILEHDIPLLLSEKEKTLENITKKTNQLYKVIYIIIVLFAITIISLVFFFLRKKKSTNVPHNDNTDNPTPTVNSIHIPQVIVNSVLQGLNSFELNKSFTSSKLTLNLLAKELKTNTTYLSKIINHYKNTSFSNYLNTLRVEYAIEQLHTNSAFRKFTIKAMAKEVGFNNSESFSKAFNKVKGVNPSDFLKTLNSYKKI